MPPEMEIFGGSLEFIVVPMLLAPFAPVQMLIVALLVQARHLFYGISMLDKYKGMGWKKPYLVFGLCDETFSINFTAKIPELLGMLVTGAVHIWKRNMFLSILVGTAFYMVLIRLI